MGLLPNFLATRPQTAETDFAGIVVSNSSSASCFKNGDKVWGIISGASGPAGDPTGQGALSEYVVVAEDRIALNPSAANGGGITVDEASGLATVGITAVQTLEILKVQPGWHIFVVGGETYENPLLTPTGPLIEFLISLHLIYALRTTQEVLRWAQSLSRC